MKSKLASLLLLCLASAAFGGGEYFVSLTPEQRALSQQLQANARLSEKRFDDGKDVSRIPAWFVGSTHASSGDRHLVAYFTSPTLAHIAVFGADKKLSDLWRFPFDARQFYIEGNKLMFAERAQLHLDTEASYERVPREVVVDFSAIPGTRAFTFHGKTYEISN